MNSSSRRTMSARGLVAALLLIFSAGFVSAQTQDPAAAVPAVAAPAADLFADAPVADRVVIETVRELAKQGKWKSAWAVLAEYDPENANPFILAQKIRVALDGHLQTTFHLMFGFEDLEAGDELLFKRMEATEPENPVEFFPGDFAQAIEDKGEAVPPVLSLYLGEYFYTVFSSYQGQWLMPDQEVLARGATQFERAYAYDVYTPESLGQYSELLMALEQYEGAEKEKVLEQRRQLRGTFNTADAAWRRGRETQGLMMSYYHRGSPAIQERWRAVQVAVDAFVDCARDVNAAGPPGETAGGPCSRERGETRVALDRLNEALGAEREYQWAGWDSPEELKRRLAGGAGAAAGVRRSSR